MKILIADDEKLARYTLKSMLKEISIPSLSIQVACDGREMVDKVGSIRPDLALVDIKMPRFNGLEAIQRARTLSPHTKWIILTSYPMFEYAKEAVALGASAYLLKPVSPQELSQAIHKIIQINKNTYQSLNDEFEAHMDALLHNTTSTEYETLEFVSDAVFRGSLLIFDSYLKEKELLAQQHRACNLIRTKQAAVIDPNTRIALCRLSDGQLALIGAWIPGYRERESSEAIGDLFRKIQTSLNSSTPQSVCFSMITGERFDNYKEFYDQLCLLNELAPLRAVIGVGGSIPWHSLRVRQEICSENKLSRNLVALSAAVRDRAYLDFLKLVDAVAATWKNLTPNRREEIHDQILRFLQVTLDFQPARPLHNDSWHEELRDHGKQLIESKLVEKPKDIINQVKNFIEKNYMNDIGVAQIADDLDLTPNYLSHLFHKKTGTTFVKHLTRLRMTKARELLADPSQQVQQVARRVGYLSTRHFSTLFKLQQGLTPSEFRKTRGTISTES